MRFATCAVLALAVVTVVSAQATREKGEDSPLETVTFLLGEWTADGGSELGNAEGATSFASELANRIVVRHNWVKYSSGKAAGTRHEDLLILYAESSGTGLRAIYFDNEGHVIRYGVTVPAPGKAVFESDPSQPGPKFRLTHAVTSKRLETKFEIAPPGQTSYKLYVSGTSTKK